MRRMVAGLMLAGAVLGACSSATDRYESAASVAAALRAGDVSCESYEVGEGAELLSDQASCISGDTELGIYVFDSSEERDRWLGVGGALEGVVVGPNWVVAAADRADAVGEALNGDIR